MLVRTTTLALVLLTAAVGRADDWPNWMGLKRDNVWRETGILDTFPAGGPKVVWQTPIAGGFASPAVSGGKVYVTDYVTAADVQVDNFDRNEFSGTERVLCLDEKTGKELWKHEYPVKYTVSYPAGPRCAPNVHAGKVYTLGAEGDLVCLDAATGKVVWSKNLKAEYKAKSPLWGYAAHPLIDGQKLITLAGTDGCHVVALETNLGVIHQGATLVLETEVDLDVVDADTAGSGLVDDPAAHLNVEVGRELCAVGWRVDKADEGVVSDSARSGQPRRARIRDGDPRRRRSRNEPEQQ